MIKTKVSHDEILELDMEFDKYWSIFKDYSMSGFSNKSETAIGDLHAQFCLMLSQYQMYYATVEIEHNSYDVQRDNLESLLGHTKYNKEKLGVTSVKEIEYAMKQDVDYIHTKERITELQNNKTIVYQTIKAIESACMALSRELSRRRV